MAVSPFVRLKLRMLGNGLRGRTSRVLLFLGGILLGLYLGGMGFTLFAASAAGDAQVRLIVASLGGGALVLGSMLLPLVWFGVDDTLDPARFALLPLSRTRLVRGLFAAALVSVPAAALLLATAGLLVPAGAAGGLAAVAAQVVGLVAGLVLCVVAGRAVVSAFASMLRSRRVRDLAGILLAAVAALLAPIQIAVVAAAQSADWDQIARIARIVGWTPFGAAYTVGLEMGAGRPLAALAKLLLVAVTVAGLLWWWSRTLESALVGATSTGPARTGRATSAGAVAQLLPRLLPGLPPTRTGALVARELRYWWRDAKRRANLIALAVIALLAPLLAGYGRLQFEPDAAGGSFVRSGLGTTGTLLLMTFVGAFAASVLANQFGFDGSAYAAHITAAVPGRAELRTRVAAHALLTVPVLLAAGGLFAVMAGPVSALGALGAGFAGYGAGTAANLHLSVVAPYAMPEGSNPFAISSGSGMAKSLLAIVALGISFLIATPLLLLAMMLGDAWPWVSLPVGAGYGVATVLLATYLVGDLLDRRAHTVLAEVSAGR